MPQSEPDREPPTTTAASADEPARPRELTEEELTRTAATSAGVSAAAPSLTPPGPTTAAAGDNAGTTWQSDARVSALWSINQDRNAWMYTWNHSTNAQIGWQRLSNASETGFVALDMLASNAKATQTRLDYRQESDGLVHEIYLW